MSNQQIEYDEADLCEHGFTLDEDCEECNSIVDEDELDFTDTRYECKCGAWQITTDGKLIHCADCCCGAE